jgi:hypothetical protein
MSIRRVYEIDDWDKFISEENYREQKVDLVILEKKYNELHGPAKKAVDALLGLK